MLLAPTKRRYVQPTSKGQITLPVSVRRALAIDPETLLNVLVERGRVVLEPMPHTPVSADRWETVIDFAALTPGGVSLGDLQRGLRSWTKSKKRSRS